MQRRWFITKINRHLIYSRCADGDFELANTDLAIFSQIAFYEQVRVAPAESLGEAFRSPILPAHINTSHRQSAGPLHPACPSSLTHHSLSTCVRLASGLHLSPPQSHPAMSAAESHTGREKVIPKTKCVVPCCRPSLENENSI